MKKIQVRLISQKKMEVSLIKEDCGQVEFPIMDLLLGKVAWVQGKLISAIAALSLSSCYKVQEFDGAAKLGDKKF